MPKKVLIVGGSSGLGRKLAELYASGDCVVGVIARRQNLLEELAANFHGKIIVHAADISDDTIGRSVSDLIARMGGLDIMIVAASVVHFNNNLAIAPELQTIDINVKGFTAVSATAWEFLKINGGGQMVFITSIAAARGNKIAPAYNASKAYQSNYAEGLRVKAKHENNNIRVTQLVPGYMDTDMGKGERVFWSASIDKAARQCMAAISRKKTRAFITKRWWLIYHIQRFMPAFLYDIVVNGAWKAKHK